MDNLKARAGDLICFATGEYSDYGYRGHFVALEDVTEEHFVEAKAEAVKRESEAEAAYKKWSKESGEPFPGFPSVHEMFIAALIRRGLLVSVNCTEHHIGSYGEIDF